MESGYTRHYAAQPVNDSASSSSIQGASSQEEASGTEVTFTATQSLSGSLLIGSSREFVDHSGKGSSTQASTEVVRSIIERAQVFLPGLVNECDAERVRVGLRPFAVGGHPIIGPVPDQPGEGNRNRDVERICHF